MDCLYLFNVSELCNVTRFDPKESAEIYAVPITPDGKYVFYDNTKPASTQGAFYTTDYYKNETTEKIFKKLIEKNE